MMAKRASPTIFRQTPLLALITACSLINMSLAVQSSWLFDSPFQSFNCINTIQTTQTSTTLQCATLCGHSNDCVGFLHKKVTLSCLHIDPNSSSDCMVNNSLQWTSWKKSTWQSVVTAVSTSTAATTNNLTTTKQTTIPTTTTEQTPIPTTTTDQTITPATTTEQTPTPTTTTEQITTPTTTTEQTTTPITTTEQTTSLTTTTEQTTTPTTTTEQTTTPTTSTEQTTTLIIMMGQLTCPITLPMNTYASTTLSDNTQFTFLFVQDDVNQTVALSRCPNYNGTLVQIITAPKMDFLLDCLAKTFEGNDYRIWIDAIKVDGLWKTSDGKAVLNDTNYWQIGVPSVTRECAVLEGTQFNYKMRENVCDTRRPFLCEKTN